MLSLVVRTIVHFRTLLVPVIAGVAVAGAVIVGALLVGDSVRGSLRHIALDRIGRVDRVLVAPRWFEPSIVDQEKWPGTIEGILLLQQATSQNEQLDGSQKNTYRANDMSLFGVDAKFWDLGTVRPTKMPVGEQVVLNRALANRLSARVGDKITLRVPAQSVVPAESALGKREQDAFVLPRWEVIEILPDESLGRFSLRSDQRAVFNAYADKSSLQQAIEIGTKVNALLATKNSAAVASGELLTAIHPRLNDLGLSLERVVLQYPKDGEKIIDYMHLTTDQMLLPDVIASKMTAAVREETPKPVLTYLANGVQKSNVTAEDDRRTSVPYSTISAVDWSTLNQLLQSAGAIVPAQSIVDGDPNWIVVNQWLADELEIKVGESLSIDYFLPETVEGEAIEKRFQASVIAIAPLTEPSEVRPSARGRKGFVSYSSKPSPFNDANWTPVVPGITDQDSISEWDTPFALKRKIDERDDDYWTSHRLTPKMFISYELGKKLFGSRFGNQSSLRFESVTDSQEAALKERLTTVASSELSSLGWRDIPLRNQQLERSSGTTPFDALFLSLSFFLIAASLLLVVLLFRLSIERRADHWGLLAATGWTRASIRKLLLFEGAVLAAVGAAFGVLLGIAYAAAMIQLLKTWWVGAITVSFLDLYLQPLSLLLGFVISWVTALVAILFSTRRLNKSPIASLLKGRLDDIRVQSTSSNGLGWGSLSCLVLGVVTVASAGTLQGQARAGAFVGAGMLFLCAGLFRVWRNLKLGKFDWSGFPTPMDLARSSAKRSPTRSILAIALVAIASFLILSMSLFQSTPTGPGLGGFQWIGKSSSPIHAEIGNDKSRKETLGDKSKSLAGVEIVSMRVRGGDDASCNNLYQANEPQILGMSPRMEEIDRDAHGKSRFAWFQTSEALSKESPWKALGSAASGEATDPIPVVLDQNTALWALHLGGYVGETFHYEFDGRPLYLRTVGVLQNTILQGSLIIGEENFRHAFPSLTGYKAFLVRYSDGSNSKAKEVQETLEDGWEEPGLSLVTTESVLLQLLAVQNTYLSAFQLLGALGLLLGTIGLGVAQLRGAMERRSELAAMRAIGFSKSRLTWLLALENGWQLLRGLLVGIGAAALATVPALLGGQPFSGIANPMVMLSLILIAGITTSWLSAFLAMRWPLLQSLRSSH